MAPKKRTETKRPIESYEHRDKERVNNPPVGLVTPGTDPDAGQKKKRYAYDPHLDPQLVWAGKAEHTSFEVHGFDYFNTKTGGIESGGEDRIAVWMLDTDYDGRSLYCGYFDSGYLGYEAAEGIDWVWEHRMDDLAEFGL